MMGNVIPDSGEWTDLDFDSYHADRDAFVKDKKTTGWCVNCYRSFYLEDIIARGYKRIGSRGCFCDDCRMESLTASFEDEDLVFESEKLQREEI